MMKLFNITYFLLIITLIFIISLNSISNLGKLECKNIQVNVDTVGDLFFIDTDMVKELIIENNDYIISRPFEDINTYLLEEFINNHPNIKKAELYLTIDGNFCIDVKQRQPIVRVFQENDSYYLDDEIMKFTLSDKYTARVLHVYWSEITEERRKILATIIEYIEKDQFLKAQITAIEFDGVDELILYPRVGDYKIILGDSYDLVNKFERLKLFCLNGLEKVGRDRYSHINLKFDNQVVCTKK